MPSESFARWQRSRAADLDEIGAAHGAIGSSRRGRRWATRQINHAYVVILTAHFQGYCRDLHSECLDALVRVAEHDSLRFVIGAGGIRGRLLDRGNPNPGNIGADFGRLVVAFWPETIAKDAPNAQRQAELSRLVYWRHAIPKLAVAMRLSVKVALRRIVGTIVEDRGPIGSGGRRLFAVRARYDTVLESVCEWPAEDLRVLAPRRGA